MFGNVEIAVSWSNVVELVTIGIQFDSAVYTVYCCVQGLWEGCYAVYIVYYCVQGLREGCYVGYNVEILAL